MALSSVQNRTINYGPAGYIKLFFASRDKNQGFTIGQKLAVAAAGAAVLLAGSTSLVNKVRGNSAFNNTSHWIVSFAFMLLAQLFLLASHLGQKIRIEKDVSKDYFQNIVPRIVKIISERIKSSFVALNNNDNVDSESSAYVIFQNSIQDFNNN